MSGSSGIDLEGLTDGQLLGLIDAAFDRLGDDRLRMPSDQERLRLAEQATLVQARATGYQQHLAAELDSSMACWHEHKTSILTWLGEHLRFTPTEAARLVRGGQTQERFPVVGKAARDGVLLPAQHEAITSVLAKLPTGLETAMVRKGEAHLVSLAATHTSRELRLLSRHLLEVIAPQVAEQEDADRVAAEDRAARRERFVDFHPDYHGQVHFRGSLPVADGETFMRLIDSYKAAQQRGDDLIDPQAEYLSPGMRRADALVALLNHHQQESLAPNHGGDRPRVVISVKYENLVAAAQHHGVLDAHLVGSGERLPAGVLRQMLCDADILPVVLGGASQVLDVGRTQRLATPPIRAALELRDGGCVFPGCDKPPQACHAHHINPWWAGGRTDLGNLVLVCPHHHGIVEPTRDTEANADRWSIKIRADGLPEVVPPQRVDPRQQPRLHARFWNRE